MLRALSVERQYGLGYLAIGEVSQVITRNSARRRSQRRDQRISICSLRDCQRHRHEKYVRWHQEYRAFDESDDGQPKLGSGAGGLLQGPVVKLAQHRATISKSWHEPQSARNRRRSQRGPWSVRSAPFADPAVIRLMAYSLTWLPGVLLNAGLT